MGSESEGGGPLGFPSFIIAIVAIVSILIYSWRKYGRERREDEEQLDREREVPGYSLCFCCCETGSEGENDCPESEGSQLSLVIPSQRFPTNTLVEQVYSDAGIQSFEISKLLEHLQYKIQGESKEDGLKIIHSAQQLILMKNLSPTENSLQTTLVIGVDATPKLLGGYCVNLRKMTMEYYTIKMEDFPLTMESQNNPEEFEMKNLQFALTLWGNSIRKYKKFRVYTDNYAMKNDKCKFGSGARALLDHFTKCEDAVKVNKREWISRKENLEQFAVYIQPADDFSRWEIDEGINFLCNYYRISGNNVQGTCRKMRKATSGSKAWFDPSENYHQYIQRAKSFARNFKCSRCPVDTFYEQSSQKTPRIRSRSSQRQPMQELSSNNGTSSGDEGRRNRRRRRNKSAHY